MIVGQERNSFLEKGDYRKIPYWIVRAWGGWVCCYIDVAGIQGFDFNENNYDPDSLKCNGGVTFASTQLVVGNEIFKGHILGWDYAHAWDIKKKYSIFDYQRHVKFAIDDLLSRYGEDVVKA